MPAGAFPKQGQPGVLMWMEIQEGKLRMKNKEFFKELGATSSCVMRAVKFCSDYITCNGERERVDPCAGTTVQQEMVSTQSGSTSSQDKSAQAQPTSLILGDSWFGSVKTAAHVARSGHHCCFMVKTAHSRSPKSFLEEHMKNMPGGTWIVLEGRAEKEGVDLVSLGYKYNRKKVLTFIFSKGAGSTVPGLPYVARFPDAYGNVCKRSVARPQIVSTYFMYSNMTDLHNKQTQ